MRWWWWSVLAAFLVGPTEGMGQDGMLVGQVRTAEGDVVAAADVRVERGDSLAAATVTDASGLFRVPGLPAGAYRVTTTSLGYEPGTAEVEVAGSGVTRVEIVMRVQAVVLEDVRVQARRDRARFEEQAGATVVELAGSDIERLPGLAEADVLRAVEVLPGVISTSDFSASFNVRGGAADQNLVLLDGVPIYNPFHLGGVFGVFNADMVERTELLAGGFPARYGGRVSSVLDVRSDAGDGTFGVDAGVSLLASRVAVSGGLPESATRPLGLGRANGRISVRRSYFDALLSPFLDFPYHLTDVQGVGEVWTENGVWTVSGYTGEDVLDLRGSEDFPLTLRLDWGNDVLGVRWAGMLGDLALDGRLSSSSFATGIDFPDVDDTRIRSDIGEWRGGLDLSWTAGNATFGVGGELAHLTYDNVLQTGGTVFGQSADEGWLGASYAQLNWESSRWLVELGARLDVWDPESADAWVEASPRLAVKRFFAGGDAAVKVATGRFTQALHSLRDEEVPIGIDLWITAGEGVPLVVSDQVQVGFERFIDGWHGSVEAYYRTFDGVVATNTADNPNDPLDDVLVGSGTSWGVDLLVRRERLPDRRLDGWIAVSYLKADRTFPDPTTVDGRTVRYPPIYDRRWDVDLVLRYPLPGGIDAGLRFNYGSGLPHTRPVAAYPVYSYGIDEGTLTPGVSEGEDGEPDELDTAVILGDRNAERYPGYHRLDLSFRRPFPTSWGRVTPFLDLLNVYNRRDNVLFYFYDYAASPPERSGVSMLPILPTLGVEVTF